jgi:hypothetical protein
MLSSNNAQERSESLNGQAGGSVSVTYARRQLSLITINFQAIPLNHWVGNPGRLDLMEYADEQTLALVRAGRRVSSAEKVFVRKRLQETSVLRRAIHRSMDEDGKTLFHKAQKALALARAAEQTIIAEKKLAAKRVVELELRLKTAQEALQAADSKLCTAGQQVTCIMGTMQIQGLLSRSPFEGEPANNRRTHHHGPESDVNNVELSDLSAFESYYDASSSLDGGC